jgi:hypothetical protein
MYDPPKMSFVGKRGPQCHYINGVPTFMRLFWPYLVVRKIMQETNQYATEVDEARNTIDGPL